MGLAACSICLVGLSSLGGATNCTCTAGFTGNDGAACAQCVAGKFKAATGSGACSFCPDNTTSLAGSTVIASCECNPGYTVSDINRRALALVPESGKLSTLANRYQDTSLSTAQFSSTAGPPGFKGAVQVNRATSQYLNGGLHTFNIADHGFTLILVVMLTGSKLADGFLVDFGSGQNNNNIALWRTSSSDGFNFGFWNGGHRTCVLQSAGMFQLNVWRTVVLQYTPSNRILKLNIGTYVQSMTCPFLQNRQISETFVGKTSFSNNNAAEASIAGLYAVDALISAEWITAISPHAGRPGRATGLPGMLP